MLGLRKTPEQRALKEINADFADMAKYFADKISYMVDQNKLDANVSAVFQTAFAPDTWAALAAQDFAEQQKKDPKAFRAAIAEQFNLQADENLLDTDILQIDLQLEDSDPHPIDYFSGFSALLGYQKFKRSCSENGMDFQLYYDPQEDGQARIGFVIWSVDKRPLLSCLRDPKPSEKVYEHP